MISVGDKIIDREDETVIVRYRPKVEFEVHLTVQEGWRDQVQNHRSRQNRMAIRKSVRRTAFEMEAVGKGVARFVEYNSHIYRLNGGDGPHDDFWIDLAKPYEHTATAAESLL